jgi:hypothetical protein
MAMIKNFFSHNYAKINEINKKICNPQHRDVQVGKTFIVIITALSDFSAGFVAL